jgi:membrane protein YdbS with pleckstrin-like domain
VVFNVVSLSRVPDFNWPTFFLVAKWAGLAYAITAGMLLYVFVKDGTSGGQLVVLTLSLVVYAIHVPLLIGFTVARYEPLPDGLRGR